jgi:hypothetical protein
MKVLAFVGQHSKDDLTARLGWAIVRLAQLGATYKRSTHVEALLAGPWYSASIGSASLRDGGVRVKRDVRLNPAHWIALERPLHADYEASLQDWFAGHRGEPYDLFGAIGSVVPALVRHGNGKWFCTEAVAAALRYSMPHTLCPAAFYLAEIGRGAIDVTQDFFEGAQ